MRYISGIEYVIDSRTYWIIQLGAYCKSSSIAYQKYSQDQYPPLQLIRMSHQICFKWQSHPLHISCGNLWNLWTHQLIGIPEIIPHSYIVWKPCCFHMPVLRLSLLSKKLSIETILEKMDCFLRSGKTPIIVRFRTRSAGFGALTCPNTSWAGEKCLILWSHDNWYILTIFERRSCKNMFAQTTQLKRPPKKTQHGKTIKTIWTWWNGTISNPWSWMIQGT